MCLSRWVSKKAIGKAPAKAARHSPSADRCLQGQKVYCFQLNNWISYMTIVRFNLQEGYQYCYKLYLKFSFVYYKGKKRITCFGDQILIYWIKAQLSINNILKIRLTRSRSHQNEKLCTFTHKSEHFLPSLTIFSFFLPFPF